MKYWAECALKAPANKVVGPPTHSCSWYRNRKCNRNSVHMPHATASSSNSYRIENGWPPRRLAKNCL